MRGPLRGRTVTAAVVVALAVGGLALACRGAGEAPGASRQAAQPQYYCPMHPTYTSDRPGECAICGMDLVKREAGAAPATATVSDASTAEAPYYCPMHPTYTSDRPGECPICGMDLVPIPAADAAAAAPHGAGDVTGLVAVTITPERIQQIGVRTTIVGEGAGAAGIERVGFVAPDESALRRVQLRVSGYVEKLYVDRTGERVTVGQPLLTIYSPELFASEQEFLVARGHTGPGGEDRSHLVGHDAGVVQASRERLHLFGVPDDEIARLEREGTATTRLTLRSPVSGTVLERMVTQGQTVDPDTPLLLVADLSRVWVTADLYEADLGAVSAGDRATFTVEALPGRRFEGRIELVLPTVESSTRTLPARFTVANPGGVLRPGMFGRVRITGRAAPGLVVPAEAVVRTGAQDYVFLAHAGGRFEPRRVTVGGESGGRIRLLGGVARGDTLVASASFLIDSESRIEAAIQGLGAVDGATP
jgi:multidrug efflux pump subunit AcrA (membrane-fusion protein)